MQSENLSQSTSTSENTFNINQFVLCSLFCAFICWVLIKIFINANIIQNPFAINTTIKTSFDLNLKGNYPSFNSDCPFCCTSPSNSLKFRATTPCNEIETKQCNGLDINWCKNNDLCEWKNNSCNYKDKYPFKNIPCSKDMNIGCAYAITDSF